MKERKKETQIDRWIDMNKMRLKERKKVTG